MQIEIKGVSKRYRRKKVLRGISVSAQSGECIGILGGNGSGKSTLLSVLAGVQKENTGVFLCDGVDLFTHRTKRRHLLGYVPQGTPLLEELTAKDNLRLWYAPKELQRSLQDGLLKTLGIDAFMNTPVSKMSGGMKKRLSIGCAVSENPPILLLDEPMAALDITCKQEISAYLQQYKQAGGIVLLVTHDVTELALCDRLYILKNGILHPFVFEGDVDALVKSL